ncbi:MAG: tRNA 2-thiouridine(34) synthase MnmA [Desulfosoma sp.]|uniref:tRNA 2-thiouridine(34) synthase MnmA n=1 Tax=Desulfosoma sp. TaxID=2603217 RepID=UPI00404A4092
MRVAIALSGGMDSLRAAWLLKEAGHEVVAFHMRLPTFGSVDAFEADPQRESNLWALAHRLDIPLFVVDCREIFLQKVIDPFLQAYAEGLTPNPCVVCNPGIKFGYLLQQALKAGADKLATGHYVRLGVPERPGGRYALLSGLDARKDQSYFLYGLRQEQLAYALFPLGKETKESTRLWARTHGFDPLIPEESQEICFIASGDYRRFVQEHWPQAALHAEGPVRDASGAYIGRHKGLYLYTVGQRRGIDIPSTAPYYVLALDPKTNTLWVGRSQDLLASEALVAQVNWVSVDPPMEPVRAFVRLRHQHRPAPAWIHPQANGTVCVRFDVPQRAVTPGQAAVFYDGNTVLGGGVLQKKPMEP